MDLPGNLTSLYGIVPINKYASDTSTSKQLSNRTPCVSAVVILAEQIRPRD